MGESETGHLFTVPCYLIVTNVNLVTLTFTSTEEISFFFSLEAVKLNLHLLGSPPRRRHKRVRYFNLWRHSKNKALQKSWGHEAPAAEAVDNQPGRCSMTLLNASHQSTAWMQRETECVWILHSPFTKNRINQEEAIVHAMPFSKHSKSRWD